MIPRCRILLLFLCCAFALPAPAQQPFMRNYSVSDGLPSFEVYDVFQDSKGFMWFATDAGVSRYDGYRFHNFTSRDGLADNTIFGFHEDKKGRIWFRSYNGQLSYYDGSTIIQPPVNAALKKILAGGLLLSIYVDPEDTVWLGLRGDKSLIRILPGFGQLAPDLPDKFGHMVREMEPGKYHISSNPKSKDPTDLLFYSAGSRSPINIGFVYDNVYAISCAKLADGQTIIGLRERHFVIGGGVQEVADTVHVLRIVPFAGQQYWRCLAGRKGVQLVEYASGREQLRKIYLEGCSVSSGILDHEGGIWLTTLEKGIFYMPYPGVEEILVPQLGNGEKITAVTSFNGSMVASTSFGQLIYPDATDRPADEAFASRAGYTYCVVQVRDKLVVGANQSSVIYDPATRQYQPIRDSTGPLPVVAMTVFDAQRLCGVTIRSAYMIDSRTGAATFLQRLPERIRGICKGRGDTLWLGGISGLWMLVPGQAPVSMAGLDPLLGQRIDFLYYDAHRDRLWMSSKGVGLLLKEGNRITSFSHTAPAVPATCRALTADHAGNIWVATNAGAFCVREKTGGDFAITEYSIRNGLPSNDIIGIWRNMDTVWMAASDRIIHFRLGEYPHNVIPPPLYMSGILVNGRETFDFPLRNAELHFDENTIAFSFLGLSYKSSGQVLYRFRLSGADTGWTETGLTEAAYYKLPPGDYSFSLYALNNDGYTQERPLRFDFTILPPFWQRWWFVVPAALLILTVLTLLFRTRIRRVRQKEIFNRRLVEMEMTALRAQMNPHFIFNAINSIQNFVLKGDRNTSSAYLSKFARLIRNVLENSGQKQIPLSRELETLRLYIEIEHMRFSDGFDFRIETAPGLDLSSNMVVPLLLQPYVENAIWHGLLHKRNRGSLLVSVEDAGNMLRCIIEDDGVGRAQAALNKQQRSAGNNSMGGEISLRRLNLLNSLYGTKFSLKYTDKQDPDGSAAGTRVELLVPKVSKIEHA